MTLQQKIAAMLETCEAATPGPWHTQFLFGSSDLPVSVNTESGSEICCVDTDCVQPTINFKFIASARTNYPAALRALAFCVRYLEACVDEKLESNKTQSEMALIEIAALLGVKE